MGFTITSPLAVAANGLGDSYLEKQHPAARIGHLLAASVGMGFSLVT
jgi:hypothetical protein